MNVIKRNNINILGNGEKTLLFIHGYGCDQTMWRLITPAFIETHKIILIDLVGCGRSDNESYDYDKYDSLDGYTNDLIEICHELGLKDITLIGHSISANISMLASIAQPKLFKELVLVCPSPKFINEDNYIGGFEQADIDELIETVESNYLGWSKAIAPVIMGNPDKPELSTELEESFCDNNPEIAKHFAKVTFLCDNRDDLEKVKTKTHIIECKEDNLVPIEVGHYIQSKIEGSNLSILNTNGHCPHLSNPTGTIELIHEFIS